MSRVEYSKRDFLPTTFKNNLTIISLTVLTAVSGYFIIQEPELIDKLCGNIIQKNYDREVGSYVP